MRKPDSSRTLPKGSLASEIRSSLAAGFSPREAAILAGVGVRYAYLVRERASKPQKLQSLERMVYGLREELRTERILRAKAIEQLRWLIAHNSNSSEVKTPRLRNHAA